MGDTGDVSVRIEGTLAIVTIERPEVRNALRYETLLGLQEAVAKSFRDTSVKAIVVTGAGERAFSSGADLKALHQTNPGRSSVERYMAFGQTVCSRIWGSPKPVVAAIDGYALGGGFEVALSCHLRVATERSKLGLPEIKLRHLPSWGGTSRLAALTRVRTLFQVTLSGEVLDGREAYEAGIVDELAEPGVLLDRARDLANRISVGEPEIVARGLEILRRCLDVENPGVLAMERWAAAIDFDTDAHREEIDRFVNKRGAARS